MCPEGRGTALILPEHNIINKMSANARIQNEEIMSASTIIDTAPLGALIRHRRQPKPPALHKKAGSTGTLQRRRPPWKKEPPGPIRPGPLRPPGTLHEGNFPPTGDPQTIMRSHSADSLLIFEVAEGPKPGQIRVLLDFGGNMELLHLAESVGAAGFGSPGGYRNARLEMVGEDISERAGEGQHRRLSHRRYCPAIALLQFGRASIDRPEALAYIANQMEFSHGHIATLF